MTNEQVKHKIDLLDFYLQNYVNDYGEESHTAMMMAIKALEQQTCEDAVSRKAVLGLFAQNADATRPYSKTWEEVKALPSVNPQRYVKNERKESVRIMQDELISRQAVLDVIDDIDKTACMNEYHVIVDAIDKLPSVKPQYTEDEIQKMQELEQAEIQKAYEIGKAEKPNKWIPVSEGLPEENKTVIASTKYGVYPEVRYTKEYGWKWAYEAGADYWKELKVTVTAWMSLPQPYEPQESEEK